LEDQIRALKDELELVKLRAYETEKAKNQEIQDLKLALKELDQNARERQKQLEVQIDHLHYELNKARDMYTNKTKECENLHAQRLAVEAQIRKLIEENDYLVQKLHAFEKEKVHHSSLTIEPRDRRVEGQDGQWSCLPIREP
jgi:DNA repair exonuclease SbcCD ATPase subunit